MTVCTDHAGSHSVVCELDGLPLDLIRAAELTERDRQGSAAYDAFLAAPVTPAAPRAVEAPPARPTARQRGLARRMRLVELEPGWDPLSWQIRSTGLGDRRSLTTGRRGSTYPKRRP